MEVQIGNHLCSLTPNPDPGALHLGTGLLQLRAACQQLLPLCLVIAPRLILIQRVIDVRDGKGRNANKIRQLPPRCLMFEFRVAAEDLNFVELNFRLKQVGTGRLQGIKGNKVDFDLVYFWARAEDHNEPGNEGAADGDDIDRYFLWVWTDPTDPQYVEYVKSV